MTPELHKWVHHTSLKQWELTPDTLPDKIMFCESIRYSHFITACDTAERWVEVSKNPYVIVGVFECTVREIVNTGNRWSERVDDQTYSIGIWGSTLAEVLALALEWFTENSNEDVTGVFNPYSKTGIAYTAIHKPSKG